MLLRTERRQLCAKRGTVCAIRELTPERLHIRDRCAGIFIGGHDLPHFPVWKAEHPLSTSSSGDATSLPALSHSLRIQCFFVAEFAKERLYWVVVRFIFARVNMQRWPYSA